MLAGAAVWSLCILCIFLNSVAFLNYRSCRGHFVGTKNEYSIQKIVLEMQAEPDVITQKCDLWVVGAGTLGGRVCQEYKRAHPNAVVVGETKSNRLHENLRSTGVIPLQRSQRSQWSSQSVKNLVISLPPSSCEDYASEIEEAIQLWAGPEKGGSLIFSSSLAVYGDSDGKIVTESSPIDRSSPRAMKLVSAEDVILQHQGNIIRFAGLYHETQGAHSYWMQKARKGEAIESNADGLVNLIHYDDAANLILVALEAKLNNSVLIGVDNEIVERRQIVAATVDSQLFQPYTVPQFASEKGPRGKRADASFTKFLLNWQPKYPSFRNYMRTSSHSEAK